MRRFRFRLAPLLRLRTQLERGARRDLAVAVADVAAFDQRLAAADRGLADCAAQAAGEGPVGRLARALETGLRRHQWRLRQGQQAAQRQLDLARAEFAGRARDARALRQVRDQRQADWRLAAARAEQRELDELASLGRQATHRAESSADREEA